jgi:hypothetical protein
MNDSYVRNTSMSIKQNIHYVILIMEIAVHVYFEYDPYFSTKKAHLFALETVRRTIVYVKWMIINAIQYV